MPCTTFLLLMLLHQPQERVPNIIDLSTSELVTAFPELKKLDFAANQDLLENLLRKVGEQVETLFRDLPNTSAIEDVRSEVLDARRQVLRSRSQKFQYLMLTSSEQKSGEVAATVKSEATLSPSQGASLNIEEFRTSLSGKDVDILQWADAPLLTRGFASSPVYLHPLFQAGTNFRYLGRDSDKTHVIAFAQSPDMARLRGSLRAGDGKTIWFYLHGVVWVDPVSFQIVRMRTDLLPGMDTADLRYATTQITLEEIRFPNTERSLWLPHEVLVTTDWMGGIRLRNRHRYSDYRLFTVDAQEDKNRSIIKRPPE
jgi:hypothetical protein